MISSPKIEVFLHFKQIALLGAGAALLFFVGGRQATAADQTTATRLTLSCIDKEPCAIPIVDPTTTYKNLADMFAKGEKEKSCIPVRTLAAAFGINAVADLDHSTVRALRDAYDRQKIFGGDSDWPQLIYYVDANGTGRPLDARVVRALVSTELFSRNLQLTRVSKDKKSSCAVVDAPAAAQVGVCLGSATEKQPPAESCKAQAKAIEDLHKPQLAKVLGQIRVDKQEVTIPEESLDRIISRAQHPLNDKLDGDKSALGCILSFGLKIPERTNEVYFGLDVAGKASDGRQFVYNCSPNRTGETQIKTANSPNVDRRACNGQALEWFVSGKVLDTPGTQPLAFLLQFENREPDGTPFEVKIEIAAQPRPGATAANAAWKLAGRCR